MGELHRQEAVPAARETSGERLSRAAKRVAGRLAQLLTPPPGPGADPLARHRAFLESLHAEAQAGTSEDPATDPSQPLARLAHARGLSAFEVDLLLLAGLPEEHEGLCFVLRALHPRGEPRASVGLAAQLLCESEAERHLLRATLETGPAVRCGALQLEGDGPFFERGLRVAEALWSALHGLEAWPAGITCRRRPPAMLALEDWLEGPSVELALRALRSGQPCTVLVTAEAEEVALQRAGALALAAGLPPTCLSPTTGAWTPPLERLASAHALTRGVLPLLRLPPQEGPGTGGVPNLDDHPAPLLVAARAGSCLVRGQRPVILLSMERLTATAQRRIWASLLPELAAQAPVLAARHPLEPTEVHEVVSDTRAMAALEERSPRIEDVALSVRTRAAPAASASARRIQPTARWEDLVLPPNRLVQLREGVGRLLQQAQVLDTWGFLAGRPGARGVRMLFAGPPGTGKTLSAEVLAHTLGVDLLMVDLSRVVSKWIGETEKNLGEVFDAAEHTRAALLFDEADALFGKRSEVRDAHDRYANLETAYLLSRLERFEGLAILSTNLRQNIDPAFTRRLEFLVEFEEPSLPERLALWRCHLPPTAPLAPEVNLQELAALYPLVGGLIRNAAVAAGFLAAMEGSPITRHHLVHAVRREYEKAGRAFPGVPAGMTAR